MGGVPWDTLADSITYSGFGDTQLIENVLSAGFVDFVIESLISFGSSFEILTYLGSSLEQNATVSEMCNCSYYLFPF